MKFKIAILFIFPLSYAFGQSGFGIATFTMTVKALLGTVTVGDEVEVIFKVTLKPS